MTNDVTRAPANNVRDPYAAYADEISTRPFDGDLLRFTKHGEYKAGQEQTVLDEGMRMIVGMPFMKRGWVKWEDNQPVAHILGLVSEGFTPQPREELGDLDEAEWELLGDKPNDPWQMTTYLPMCDTEGRLYTYITSSKGGAGVVAALSQAYATRRRMKPNEIPVIELSSRTYDHKQYGETFAPVFKVIGWTVIPMTFTELSAVEDSSDESLALEDLMQTGHEGEDDSEVDTTPRGPRRDAPQRSQKPAQRAAPQKPAPKAAAKAPPPRGKTNNNGARRSPRL